MNDVLVVESTSFRGWRKESIKYCLEKVRFHPNVTETLLAEAVLSAATGNLSLEKEKTKTVPEVQQESPAEKISTDHAESGAAAASEKEDSTKNCSDPEREKEVSLSCKDETVPEGQDSTAAEESVGRVESGTTSEKEDGPKNSDSEREISLSRKDVEEIFKGHINLALIEPSFVQNRIEPLQILWAEMLAAAYRVQCICFSRGVPRCSFFTMPWRSMCRKPSFAPVETEEGGLCNTYNKVSLPSFWSISIQCSTSDELPQRVWSSDPKFMRYAIMKLLIHSGKHIWSIRLLKRCGRFSVGVVSSSAKGFQTDQQTKEYWMLSMDHDPWVSSSWTLSPTFLKTTKFEKFDKSGATVVVILDMKIRALTFANDLESYLSHTGEYPLAFQNLPCSVPLYPALWISGPGCAEIEWIESSPREQFVRPSSTAGFGPQNSICPT
ncbi:hypothetical protein CBR_g52293 [Chara braunii]|uniref:SPRY domain-containing protein n=1 Tax=Chara braunii TaxID=69332 RepID=A0A388MA16_CHABU|nr:hypothetical protein CBR_g52293 [Chara braunii]|eukprot:GBG91406.1 hypothetical protein CBR_g52293 [Chara braunii]